MPRLLLLLLLMAASSTGGADIYKWQDKNGVVHFGDNATGQGKVEKVDVKVVTYTHVTYKKIKTSAPPAEAGKKSVVMYGTSWCGYCKKARAYFQSKNIPFTDFDVEASATAKAQFMALAAAAFPS